MGGVGATPAPAPASLGQVGSAGECRCPSVVALKGFVVSSAERHSPLRWRYGMLREGAGPTPCHL